MKERTPTSKRAPSSSPQHPYGPAGACQEVGSEGKQGEVLEEETAKGKQEARKRPPKSPDFSQNWKALEEPLKQKSPTPEKPLCLSWISKGTQNYSAEWKRELR